MSVWRGCVRWAFVPFTPAAPFHLYAGQGVPPVTEPDATDWATRIYRQGGTGDQTFLVSGKLRPVLVLDDPPEGAVITEIMALRPVRLETRSADQQEEIRHGRHPSLLFLKSAQMPAAAGEHAISLASLVRLDVSAVVKAKPVARLGDNDFRSSAPASWNRSAST